MDRLQYLLYADASQSLLIVLQGLDAAIGKKFWKSSRRLKNARSRLIGHRTGKYE